MENNSSNPLDYIKGVVEALLFVNEKPVTIDQIKRVLQSVTPTDIKQAIESLKEGYAARSGGVTIEEIAGGFQMLSNPQYVSYVRNFYKTKHKEKLSKPALETLAIIAYKQPVTRADIELIRGVNSDGVVAHLLDKELIKMAGRKDVPGRPFLYGTTKQFLEYFGLKSLDTLPNLEELVALQTKDDGTASETENAEGIPEEELSINTMERQKQEAITKAEGEYQPLESEPTEVPTADATEDTEEIMDESQNTEDLQDMPCPENDSDASQEEVMVTVEAFDTSKEQREDDEPKQF